MAIQMLSKFEFPSLLAIVYYDDATLLITRVEVTNSGSNAVTITVNKLDPPKKTFAQAFQPNTTVGYNVPTGFKLTTAIGEDGSPEIVSPFTITVGGG